MKQNNYRISDGVKMIYVLAIVILIGVTSLNAQERFILNHEDSLALENVIVEKYYIADSTDYADTTGGILPKGSVTYRLYIDMKPDYALMMVFGDKEHELFFKTTTTFFNNTMCLAMTGFNVGYKGLNKNTVALDSWITLGAASRIHTGILKSEDADGSILKRASLSKADGFTDGITPTFKTLNLDMSFFKNKTDASYFSTNTGAWYCLEGVKGPTVDNRVLIAQLTTNGILSYALNVQLKTPKGAAIQFVAKNAKKNIIPQLQFSGLAN